MRSCRSLPPFLLEEATEQGVVDLFRSGAKSLFYALDEGALLFDKRLDVAALLSVLMVPPFAIPTVKRAQSS